jgi:hypothetical protein
LTFSASGTLDAGVANLCVKLRSPQTDGFFWKQFAFFSRHLGVASGNKKSRR